MKAIWSYIIAFVAAVFIMIVFAWGYYAIERIALRG